jgi:hypothetical protein
VLQQISLNELSLPEINVEYAETETGAGASSKEGLSAMSGLYMGQIDARIERAWSRPRTPLNARAFSCSVRIEQDDTRHVRNITLVGCNGDARWQQSLVQGIRAASPLPAPPDPMVFRRVITLSFHAEAYSATSEQGLYEPAGPTDLRR